MRSGYLGEETARRLGHLLLASEWHGLSGLFQMTLNDLENPKSPVAFRKAPKSMKRETPISYFAGEYSPTILASGLLIKLALARKAELWRFINSLNIRLIGPEVAKPLATHFANLESLFSSDVASVAAIDGVGVAAATSLFDWWSKDQNKDLIRNWLGSGVSPITNALEIDENRPLAGLNVLVTGTLKSFDREQVKLAIKKAGGKAAAGVSGSLSFAVIGDKAGASKLTKLAELGIEVIDEDEFVRRLAGSPEVAQEAIPEGAFLF